jgi:uncharacterized metal-binding protein
MASGKTHAGITTAASGILAISMWKFGFTVETIRLAAMGCMSGIFLSPDMDVDAGFLGYAYIDRYLGKIVGTIWRALWWPYAVLIPHRSWWSHAPIISTALRLAYWYLIYLVGCILFKWPVWTPDLHHGYLYAGLAVSDALHYITDIISTSLKRRCNASLHFPMSEMRQKHRDRA